MGRAPCCDKANVKKGSWSPEEDDKLKSYIEKNGTGGNWIALPQKIGLKRCGKSCRLRWLNYLRPNIKHGGFTEVEDDLICTLYISIGSRWSVIAAQLPGRTDNDIKNYWNTRLKKKLLGYDKPSRQRNLGSYMPSETKKECYYESHQNQLREPSASNVPVMPPQLQANSYSDQISVRCMYDDVCCPYDDHHCPYESNPLGSGVRCINYEFEAGNYFPGFGHDGGGGVPEEIMPGGLDGFSAVDLVNCGTVTSTENVNWGDICNPTVYPCAVMNNYLMSLGY